MLRLGGLRTGTSRAVLGRVEMRYSRAFQTAGQGQMEKYLHGLAQAAVSAWAGGMWAIGYLAVPLLFHALPDRMLAGALAGQLFAGMAYTGLGCGLYLLAYGYWQCGTEIWRKKIYRVVIAMLLAVILGQFALQPLMTQLKMEALPLDVMHSAFAGRFKMLHGVASVLYLLQSLLALGLVLGFSARKCP